MFELMQIPSSSSSTTAKRDLPIKGTFLADVNITNRGSQNRCQAEERARARLVSPVVKVALLVSAAPRRIVEQLYGPNTTILKVYATASLANV
jgi:hypothetical protein